MLLVPVDSKSSSSANAKGMWRAATKRLVNHKFANPLLALLVLHAIVLIALHPHAVAASRWCTAAMAGLAALCACWRAQRVPLKERASWRWAGLAILLWGIAHAVETVLGASSAASNLSVDPSDFIYIPAAFPLLMAFCTTRETASLRIVFCLNCSQIGLAFLLTYFRLYRMWLTPTAAATVMGRFYAVDCVLLVVLAGLRYFTWVTREERRSIGVIFAFVLAYLPIELGMDYASAHWNLQAGTPLDLLWSVPFVLGGWMALHLPLDEEASEPLPNQKRGRALAETLCPMLISVGVFALAASVATQHLALALAAILLLLVLQSLQAGLLQLNYLNGHRLLLDREHDLQTANAALQQLSQLDPLTCIANRRRFDIELDEAWRRAARKDQQVALLIIDLDFFKSINDVHGHAHGDRCLIALARAIEAQAGRPDDLLARFGGDEFLLLLPDTGSKGAGAVAERIQNAVRRLNIVNAGSPLEERVTISVGIGIVQPNECERSAELIEAADRALYEAKRLGRNRTCLELVPSNTLQRATA
jgi:diguanylate cyclase (GGDEF)-like protein